MGDTEVVKFWLLFLLLAATSWAEESAAVLAKSIQDAGLDPQECYRVRDLAFQKDDIRVYLTEGHLIFSRPVKGRRFAAVFATDVPGGDAEVIVFPPHRSERLSLAVFTKTPNLDEHLNTGLLLFTDGTGEQLLGQLAKASAKKAPEAGLLLDSAFTPVLKNIAGSYETRLVQDLMSSRPDQLGLFYATVSGRTLGNFDILYDPRAREQVLIGQVAFRNERRYFDTWTSFVSRPYRMGRKSPPSDAAINLKKVQIDATLEPDMHLKALTRLTFTVSDSTEQVIAFDLSRRMKVNNALVNGEPAEIFRRDALRVNLMRGENELFLVVLPKPLAPGAEHVIEFRHEGDVVASAGNGVYYVAARNSWYPNRDATFAPYELTFRYPKTVDLVATGEVVEDRTEGELRITKRATSTPVRFAGFNLGNYEKVTAKRGALQVEVYANRRIEAALQPRQRDLMTIPPPPLPGRQGRRQPDLLSTPVVVVTLNPTARLQQLASEVTAATEFMSAHLGPPPLKTLTVSPIPGTFGQGFPGLIYLSTLAYLNPGDRPMARSTEMQRLFFSELLHSHEVAHQWWGNMVTTEHYQDDWLMESLANYSSLMFLEKKKGRKALEDVLAEYRDNLLIKDDQDRTVESAGPIVWGSRLYSSQAPKAWRTITYEKGSWIMHMLRMRMGDDAFQKMLGQIVQRYRYKGLTTEKFRQLAIEFIPAGTDDPKLENFFEQWVQGTGVPALKLSYAVSGKAPKVRVRGTVTQTGVSDDFSASVPVEIQVPGRKPVVKWVRTSDEPVPFTVDLHRAPSRVVLAPGQAVLTAKN
jgi:hypothetical protein